MKDDDVGPRALIDAARGCLNFAHAPYSRFPVAAAVVDENGRVFTGVNVENASYGLTMCAERVAIGSAIAAGSRRITAVAVTALHLKAIPPCGACRQVISEFCDASAPVYSDKWEDGFVQWTAEELLPYAFTDSDLNSKKEQG